MFTIMALSGILSKFTLTNVLELAENDVLIVSV